MAKVTSKQRVQSSIVETMERRILFDTTITIPVAENQGITFVKSAHDHIDIDFKRCSGFVTITGTNLVQTPVKNGGVLVTGTVTVLNEVHVTASSKPLVADVLVDGVGYGADETAWVDLQKLVDDVSVHDVEIHGVDSEGFFQFAHADIIRMDDAHDARLDASDGIGQLSIKTVLDSTIQVNGQLKRFSSDSFIATMPGSSSLSARWGGSINVRGAYTGDLNLVYSPSYKYTLGTLQIGGKSSGTWDIPGTTHYFSTNSIASTFVGTFGRVDSLAVNLTDSGNITAGSIGKMSVGGSMNYANLTLTNPFAPNIFDLGQLMVGSSIIGSRIISPGNIGTVHTMYTYYSYIAAGIIADYVFGGVPTASDYTSLSYIKSFFSDCPSGHNYHFEGGYVGAYHIGTVHIGKVLTQYGGSPFGIAGARIDSLTASPNGKEITLKNLAKAADVTAGLSAQNVTPQALGDFQIRLPIN